VISKNTRPGPFRYRAFISYSRKDFKQARWIYQQLSAFKPPRTEVGSAARDGSVPVTLGSLFIDTVNASAGGGVREFFDAQLKASAALVVLCSPHSAASSSFVWREIEGFKLLRPGAPIVPVIVGGEPPSCFPPPLGSVEEAGVTDWPLAADLRPGEGREKRAQAIAKIAAGILGVEDAERFIRSAARRRERRRRLTAAGVSAASLALAWGVSDILVESARTEMVNSHTGISALIAALPPEGSLFPTGGSADVAASLLAKSLNKVQIADLNATRGVWCRDQDGRLTLSRDADGFRIWDEKGTAGAQFLRDKDDQATCAAFQIGLNRVALRSPTGIELWSIRPTQRIALLALRKQPDTCGIVARTLRPAGDEWGVSEVAAPPCFDALDYQFLPGVRRVLTRSADGGVGHLWSSDSGQYLASFPAPRSYLVPHSNSDVEVDFNPKFSPQKHQLVSFFETRIILVDVITGQILRDRDAGCRIRRIVLSEDSSTLVVSCQAQLKFYSTDTLQERSTEAGVAATKGTRRPYETYPLAGVDRLLLRAEAADALVDLKTGAILFSTSGSTSAAAVIERIGSSHLLLSQVAGDQIIDIQSGRRILDDSAGMRFVARSASTDFVVLYGQKSLWTVPLSKSASTAPQKLSLPETVVAAIVAPPEQSNSRTAIGVIDGGSWQTQANWGFGESRMQLQTVPHRVLLQHQRTAYLFDADSGALLMRSNAPGSQPSTEECRDIRKLAFTEQLAADRQPKPPRPPGLGQAPPPPLDFITSPELDALRATSVARAADFFLPSETVPQPESFVEPSRLASQMKEYQQRIDAAFAACSGVDTLLVSPDERHLVTLDSDAQVSRIWDTSTGRMLRSIPGASKYLASVTNEFVVSTFGRSTVILASYDGTSPTVTHGFASDVQKVMVLEGAKSALVAGQYDLFRMDAEGGRVVEIPLPKGSWLDRLSRRLVLRYEDRVVLYDTLSARAIASVARRRYSTTSPTTSFVLVAPTQDSDAVAEDEKDTRTVVVFDVRQGRVAQTASTSGALVNGEDATELAATLHYAVPDKGFFFLQRPDRLEVTSGSRLRHALCEQLTIDQPLVWDDALSNEDNGSVPHLIPLYGRVGLTVIKSDVCADRGILTWDFWKEFPSMLLNWPSAPSNRAATR
jgi:WD40 repeat protein